MTRTLERLAELVTPEYVAALAAPDVAREARRYFHEGRVLSFEKWTGGISCKVAGSRLYTVHVAVDLAGVDATCDCGHADGGACKHVVAALLDARRRAPAPAARAAARGAGDGLGAFSEAVGFVDPARALVPVLEYLFDFAGLFRRERTCLLALRVGGAEPVPIADPRLFAGSWAGRVSCRLADNLTYDPARWRFAPGDAAALHILARSLDDGAARAEGGRLSLSADRLPALLGALDGRVVFARDGAEEEAPHRVDAAERRLAVSLREAGGGALEIDCGISAGTGGGPDAFVAADAYEAFPVFPAWARVGAGGAAPRALVRLADAAAIPLPPRVAVPAVEATGVLDALVPYLAERGDVRLAGKLADAVKPCAKPPRPQLKIDMEGVRVTVRLAFRYGNARVAWEDPARLVRTGDCAWTERAREQEQKTAETLERAGFAPGGDGAFVVEDELAVFRFIYETLPAHQPLWDVLYDKRFAQAAKRLGTPKIGVRLAKKYNFMELVIAAREPELKLDPFAVFEAARAGKGYVRLKDGQFLPLTPEQQELLKQLGDTVDFLPRRIGDATVLAADAVFAPAVADALAHAGEDAADADSAILAYSHELVSWERRVPVPAGLQATLRGYQLDGLAWLANIWRNRLGGILADDMGLGKTVQTIALVLHAVEQGETRPFLIVCPSSLVFNWEREIERFAPDLPFVSLAGSPGTRARLSKTIARQRIVVVSYALLQRDLELLADVRFAGVILDEAQHIKNPGSSRTVSAKAVQANCRIALTGTPIENSLGELWSLFDFTLPGFLFTYARFRQEVERPILEQPESGRLEELKRRIKPFMLRRTKDQVLKQLPKKTEQVLTCPLSPEQREAYRSVLAHFDASLLPMLVRDGLATHRLELLAALTRLRQICCHPGLAIERYREAPSGKLDLLFEVLDTAVDGGHKTLVFSQFTGMLDLVEARMAEEGISCVRLDGSTPTKARGKIVERFNADPSVLAFLISLKAGGTGLNLTSADTVVHVDPWWNPAAEDQASARAWRMGQTRPVNVYKLITGETVEDKILALQREKKRLFEAVVDGGDVGLSRLSLDQVRELFRMDGAPDA